MKPNISSKELYGFLALVELKHFTRAAERCHTSQSAFSALIQKLESNVGTRLFERDTRKVILTPEGALFAEVARSLVAEIESALGNMEDYVERRRGRVAVAALPSLAAKGLPAVIAKYKRLYPGVTVMLHDALSDQCISMLRQGRVDIAITAPGPNVDEFDAQQLCSDPFYLVCRKDHPLATRLQVQVADLANCEMIHLARSTSVRQHVDMLLKDVSTRPSGFEVEHLATVAGLVAQGLGVTLVPELTLFQFRDLDLVAIPLQTAGLVRPILIVRRRDQSLSIAARALLELIEQDLELAGSPAKCQV